MALPVLPATAAGCRARRRMLAAAPAATMIAAAARNAWWKAGTSAPPACPRPPAATTLTRIATPAPPATLAWVLNSADARPVSAGEIVENDEACSAMLHQAI